MSYNRQDSYYRKAKQEGYRSRAAYKLIELQQRFRIIRPGDLIVDLGAAPGGWLQIAAKLTGPEGKVIGVDLQRIEPLAAPNVLVIQGDINSAETRDQVRLLLGAPTDCVISDLAPKLSGIRETDSARALELNLTALSVACELLRLGGRLLMKTFVGEPVQLLSSRLKEHFRNIQRTRPEATRRSSSEIYFYARDFFRPPRPDLR